MGTPTTGLEGRGLVVPAPVLLAVLALAVTLLFGVALNAILASAYGGPAAGVRDATFSARGDGAPYQPAPNLSFAKQRPASGAGGGGGGGGG